MIKLVYIYYPTNNFKILKMAKPKGISIIITLECTRCRANTNNRPGGISRYTTKKNRRNTPNRLELKKFCPKCNMHTNHKEIK